MQCHQQHDLIAELYSQQAWQDLFDMDWLLQGVTSLACQCTFIHNQQTELDTSGNLREQPNAGSDCLHDRTLSATWSRRERVWQPSAL